MNDDLKMKMFVIPKQILQITVHFKRQKKSLELTSFDHQNLNIPSIISWMATTPVSVCV